MIHYSLHAIHDPQTMIQKSQCAVHDPLLMTLLFAIRNSYSILRPVINDATLVIHGSLIPVYDPPFAISYSRFVLLDQRFVIRRS
jgi:hypothetical protein